MDLNQAIQEQLESHMTNNFNGSIFADADEVSMFKDNRGASNFQEEESSDFRYAIQVQTGDSPRILALSAGSFSTARKPEVVTFDTAALGGKVVLDIPAGITTGSCVRAIGGAYIYVSPADLATNKFNMSYDLPDEIKEAAILVDAVLDKGVNEYLYAGSATDYVKVVSLEPAKTIRSFNEYTKRNSSRIIKISTQILNTSTALQNAVIVEQPYNPFANEADRKLRFADYFSPNQFQPNLIEINNPKLQFDDQTVLYMNIPANSLFSMTFSIGAVNSNARKLKVVAEQKKPTIKPKNTGTRTMPRPMPKS